ncbi:MAG: ribonuclease HII [Treponema sp.]|jgi:ribonuclease HII|nr:ribonuclease HII [Treponema sp.]
MICGIDEAGRGPLAGPVCAAAVILPPDFPIELLGDSKKLSASEREKARLAIERQALAWGIGWASPAEIDRINILKASLLAMKRAFRELAGRYVLPPDTEAIIDGLYAPDIPIPALPMVKADGKVPQVMAASILAKTNRDRLMEYYAGLYPQYGYERHKGYPTKAHREAVLRYGPSPIQRLTFTVKAD